MLRYALAALLAFPFAPSTALAVDLTFCNNSGQIANDFHITGVTSFDDGTGRRIISAPWGEGAIRNENIDFNNSAGGPPIRDGNCLTVFNARIDRDPDSMLGIMDMWWTWNNDRLGIGIQNSVGVFDSAGRSATLEEFLSGDAGISLVPEPATWSVMIGGFGVVGGLLRYRRRIPAVAVVPVRPS